MKNKTAEEKDSFLVNNKGEYAWDFKEISLVRESYFQTLFNTFFLKENYDKRAKHIGLSRIHNLDENDYFYIVKNNQKKSSKRSHLLVNVLLEEGIQPLNVLEDNLVIIRDAIEKNKYSKIYLLVEYGIKNLMVRNAHYVNQFYKRLHELMPTSYEVIEAQELVRISDFSDWDYIEAELVWAYPDSFLKHLLLSRGASVVERDYRLDEMVVSIDLSPFHLVEIGKVHSKVESGAFHKTKQIGETFFNEHKGASAISPSLFNSLVYFKI